MNDLSSFSSGFPGELGMMLWATIGGIFVAIGLIIEKAAEKMDEKFLGEYKAHTMLDWFGWGLLMFGIFIEVADAGLTANAINKQNPINQRINDLSASAYFNVAGKDVPDLVISNRFGWPPVSELIIGYNNAPLQSMLPELISDDFMRGGTVGSDTRLYTVRFNETGSAAMLIGERNNLMEVKDLEKVKFLYLSFRFLPNDSDIEYGNVEVVANGTVRFIFQIPNQLPKKQFSNSPPNAPWWIIATNSAEVFKEK